MRIAVVGAGIAGNGAAWLLSRRARGGAVRTRATGWAGHTHTHAVDLQGASTPSTPASSSNNPLELPLFSRLLAELGVVQQETTMGFSVQDARSGLEYNATSLDALFCQRRNLLSRRFWRMVREILRFYRESPALLLQTGPGPTLGEYLRERAYSKLFVDAHLVPMACALWSSPTAQVMEFPAQHLVRFMSNHQMLDAGSRPSWRVLRGGSSSYLAALQRHWRVQVRKGAGVQRVRRAPEGVYVATPAGEECFDQVVLACHADEALALLEQPSIAEREVLGALRFPAQRDRAAHRCAPAAAAAQGLGGVECVPAGGARCALHRQLLHEPAAVARTRPSRWW
jgi:predicted NAD/FAD-binding protein